MLFSKQEAKQGIDLGIIEAEFGHERIRPDSLRILEPAAQIFQRFGDRRVALR